MTLYGIANAITAFLIGKLSSNYSLLAAVVLSSIMGILTWIVVLLWIPSAASIEWVYALALLFGTSDGVWQIITAGVCD